MAKILLDKYKNDPVWAETMTLYSGLFDSQEDREAFVIELSEKDIVLASKCKTSSLNNEDNLRDLIVKRAKVDFYTSDKEKVYDSILSLIEINDLVSMIQIIRNSKSPKAYEKLFFDISSRNAGLVYFLTSTVLASKDSGKEGMRNKFGNLFYRTITQLDNIELTNFSEADILQIAYVAKFLEKYRYRLCLLNLCVEFRLFNDFFHKNQLLNFLPALEKKGRNSKLLDKIKFKLMEESYNSSIKDKVFKAMVLNYKNRKCLITIENILAPCYLNGTIIDLEKPISVMYEKISDKGIFFKKAHE